ncbi:uncharacterized protein Bfra_002080 [Botrytis fragariae]|uniref:Uncharacterized protein n=1 Tax=Botrytis fragariae TaxID=1964551 RepID=A0A8H6EMH8_9HELO|nr:uncharacterized protein Bfra_002080 [Botrytis fragariae]KAF5877713.1 hypothetical protein Bfra_002080 [Botrytis fragariae]
MQTCTAFFQLPDKTTTYDLWRLSCHLLSFEVPFHFETSAGWLTEKNIKGFSTFAKTLRRSEAAQCESVWKKGWEIKMSSSKGRETLTGFAMATNRISV